MTPRQPVSELAAHLGFLMRMVSNHVSHAFALKLAGEGVTVAEWSLLRTLHGEAPMPPSHLADRIGMTRGAITKLADRLVAKSLLAREASAVDGRAQTLALTRQGDRLVPRLAALADRNDAESFACLSAKERASLERLLKRLIECHRLAGTPVE